MPNLEPIEKNTFRWYSQAPDYTRDDLVWVIDGSALNARWSTLATFCFGIVVTDKNGDLVAWGGGVPPAWVDSASAAEAWALATVTMQALHSPEVLTDCLGLLHTSEAGTAAATKGTRQLARTWAVISSNLDGDISRLMTDKKLCWIPAHQGVAAIGVACKSNGKPITSLEWRANRLVDAIAKNESARGVAPQSSIDLINSATALVKHAAAQMGAATHLANNHVLTSQLKDGRMVRKTVRDAQDPPRKNTAQKPQPGKTAEASEEQPEGEVSDWDSTDERLTYGPDTKRARRGAQKKARTEAEAKALNHVVTETATRPKSETRQEEADSERRQELARDFLKAASSPRSSPDRSRVATNSICGTEAGGKGLLTP